MCLCCWSFSLCAVPSLFLWTSISSPPWQGRLCNLPHYGVSLVQADELLEDLDGRMTKMLGSGHPGSSVPENRQWKRPRAGAVGAEVAPPADPLAELRMQKWFLLADVVQEISVAERGRHQEGYTHRAVYILTFPATSIGGCTLRHFVGYNSEKFPFLMGGQDTGNHMPHSESPPPPWVEVTVKLRLTGSSPVLVIPPMNELPTRLEMRAVLYFCQQKFRKSRIISVTLNGLGEPSLFPHHQPCTAHRPGHHLCGGLVFLSSWICVPTGILCSKRDWDILEDLVADHVDHLEGLFIGKDAPNASLPRRDAAEAHALRRVLRVIQNAEAAPLHSIGLGLSLGAC